VKGQSGTTGGIFAVLAVLVTVAVAGALIAGNHRSDPPLEVVVDMPPPAAKSAPESVAEATPEPEVDGGAPNTPAESAADDVPEIDTAAGNGGGDEATPPNPIAENGGIAPEDRETATPPPVAVSDGAPNEAVGPDEPAGPDKATGADAEAAAEPGLPGGPDRLATTAVEPPIEERRPAATSSFFDAPGTLFDAVVIIRRSNLRSEPGTDSPVLAKLDPGERVFRLDDKPVQGYYRVSSQGVVGWVWWLNVRDGPGGNIDE
jgi:hypothetical protein